MVKNQKTFFKSYPKFYQDYINLKKKLEVIENNRKKELSDYAQGEILKQKYFFPVTYADDTRSYFAAFEHGGVFKNNYVAIYSIH